MKTSLVSRLGKFALISALTLGLLTGIKAQNKFKPKLDCYFNAFTYELGVSDYNNYPEKLDPYTNWKENFKPNGGSMDLKKREFLLKADFFVGIEPVIKNGYFEFGVPIYLSWSNIFPVTTGKTMVDWWDPVKVVDIAFKKQTPSFGASTKIKLDNDDYLKFQFLTHKYSIIKRDYVGIDCPGCVNQSKVTRKEILEDDLWAQKFLIGFEDEGDDLFNCNLGIYLEKSKKYFELGLFLTGYFKLRGNK